MTCFRSHDQALGRQLGLSRRPLADPRNQSPGRGRRCAQQDRRPEGRHAQDAHRVQVECGRRHEPEGERPRLQRPRRRGAARGRVRRNEKATCGEAMTLIARLPSLADDRWLLEFLIALAELKEMAQRRPRRLCQRQGEGAPKGPGFRRS
jgi:hypothetical protein